MADVDRLKDKERDTGRLKDKDRDEDKDLPPLSFRQRKKEWIREPKTPYPSKVLNDIVDPTFLQDSARSKSNQVLILGC